MFQKKGEAELYQAQPLEQKLYQPNGAIFWFVSICRQKIQILPTYSGYSAGRICCYLLYYIYIYLYIHLHFWGCNQILPAEYCAISCQAQPMEYKLFGPNGATSPPLGGDHSPPPPIRNLKRKPWCRYSQTELYWSTLPYPWLNISAEIVHSLSFKKRKMFKIRNNK